MSETAGLAFRVSVLMECGHEDSFSALSEPQPSWGMGWCSYHGKVEEVIAFEVQQTDR